MTEDVVGDARRRTRDVRRSTASTLPFSEVVASDVRAALGPFFAAAVADGALPYLLEGPRHFAARCRWRFAREHAAAAAGFAREEAKGTALPRRPTASTATRRSRRAGTSSSPSPPMVVLAGFRSPGGGLPRRPRRSRPPSGRRESPPCSTRGRPTHRIAGQPAPVGASADIDARTGSNSARTRVERKRPGREPERPRRRRGGQTLSLPRQHIVALAMNRDRPRTPARHLAPQPHRDGAQLPGFRPRRRDHGRLGHVIRAGVARKHIDIDEPPGDQAD